MRIIDNFIRKTRKEKGITMTELGRLSGLPERSCRVNMGNIEAGRLRASFKRIRKIAEVLDIELDEMLKHCED